MPCSLGVFVVVERGEEYLVLDGYELVAEDPLGNYVLRAPDGRGVVVRGTAFVAYAED